MSHYGVYRAIVADNNDPEGLFRLRLRIPALTGQSVTTWAWPMSRVDSMTSPPPVGSGTFAMFEGGDISYPLWTGGFAAPPERTTYRAFIGDEVSNEITIEHNLGSEDLIVSVRETGGLKRIVEVETRVTGPNTIVLVFDTPPAAGQYRVSILTFLPAEYPPESPLYWWKMTEDAGTTAYDFMHPTIPIGG